MRDYRVINTLDELHYYFNRCIESGVCSFDFETTANSSEKVRRFSELEAEAKDYKEFETKKEANAYAKRLKNSKKHFDNAPLDPHRGEICTVSLSAYPGESRVIFLSHTSGDNFCSSTLTPTEARKEFLNLFENYILMNEGVAKIAYNLVFEAKFLLKYGCYMIGKCIDPLILIVRTLQASSPEKIKNPKIPHLGKGLKAMTKEYLGVQMNDFTDVTEGAMFDSLKAGSEKATNYSAEDSDYSLQLYNYFKPLAESIQIKQRFERPYKNYYEWLEGIEMPFSRVIGQMEYHGFTWSSEKANKTQLIAEEAIEKACKSIIELGKQYGLTINPGKTGKTDSVKEFLFGVLGCPTPTLSQTTGKPSLDHEAILDMIYMVEHNLLDIKDEFKDRGATMAEYEHKADLLKLLGYIGQVQKFGTLLSSHIKGREKFVNPNTGRIHANFSPWTETSRLNSSKPNGQNVPAPGNDPFKIRNVYRAAKGKVLLLIDYSGFELRLMAWASGDRVMKSVFANNGDMHMRTAMTLTGKKAKDISKSERSIAKAGNFGINYGGTEYSLQSTFKKLGIRKSLDFCKGVVRAVKSTYPRIEVFQEKMANFASNNGYSETILGYRRLLQNINSRSNRYRRADERKASNTPIQGSAADIMKKSQNSIYDRIAKDSFAYKNGDMIFEEMSDIFSHGRVDMIQQFHDEVVLEVKDDPALIDSVVKWVTKVMQEKPIPSFDVPLIVETEIATDGWGDKMDYNEWRKNNGM